MGRKPKVLPEVKAAVVEAYLKGQKGEWNYFLQSRILPILRS
ncbi:hypothetical protein [Natranaerobius trueperi]|nr:hypothetical protein [Natranaerobius trueperi]